LCVEYRTLNKNLDLQMVGGRLKAVISGGGPLSAGTQSWVRCAMCPTFVQGYGLTETNGATCVQDLFDVRDGIAGAPLSSVELKLHSCAEVLDTVGKPYLNSDSEHVVEREGGRVSIPCIGRGELWIRGGTVADGYFKLPDKTESEFTPDGWFKTGDICMWTEDGSIKIVDRLKNLVKLRGGECVAPTSLCSALPLLICLTVLRLVSIHVPCLWLASCASVTFWAVPMLRTFSGTWRSRAWRRSTPSLSTSIQSMVVF
jgi:long-subunit acyl-CoA synthetase (AMP-forming)